MLAGSQREQQQAAPAKPVGIVSKPRKASLQFPKRGLEMALFPNRASLQGGPVERVPKVLRSFDHPIALKSRILAHARTQRLATGPRSQIFGTCVGDGS
jgi:hypothetical protein